MHWKLCLSIFILITTVTLLAHPNADQRKRMDRLKAAGAKFETVDGKRELLKLFPDNKADFDAICNDVDSNYRILEDCSSLIMVKMNSLVDSSEFAEPLAKLVVKLASEIKFDADAPNYLQDVEANLCTKQTNIFARAIDSLPAASQDKALAYLNKGFLDKNKETWSHCVAALENSGFKELAARLRKFAFKKKP